MYLSPRNRIIIITTTLFTTTTNNNTKFGRMFGTTLIRRGPSTCSSLRPFDARICPSFQRFPKRKVFHAQILQLCRYASRRSYIKVEYPHQKCLLGLLAPQGFSTELLETYREGVCCRPQLPRMTVVLPFIVDKVIIIILDGPRWRVMIPNFVRRQFVAS